MRSNCGSEFEQSCLHPIHCNRWVRVCCHSFLWSNPANRTVSLPEKKKPFASPVRSCNPELRTRTRAGQDGWVLAPLTLPVNTLLFPCPRAKSMHLIHWVKLSCNLGSYLWIFSKTGESHRDSTARDVLWQPTMSSCYRPRTCKGHPCNQQAQSSVKKKNFYHGLHTQGKHTWKPKNEYRLFNIILVFYIK